MQCKCFSLEYVFDDAVVLRLDPPEPMSVEEYIREGTMNNTSTSTGGVDSDSKTRGDRAS